MLRAAEAVEKQHENGDGKYTCSQIDTSSSLRIDTPAVGPKVLRRTRLSPFYSAPPPLQLTTLPPFSKCRPLLVPPGISSGGISGGSLSKYSAISLLASPSMRKDQENEGGEGGEGCNLNCADEYCAPVVSAYYSIEMLESQTVGMRTLVTLVIDRSRLLSPTGSNHISNSQD
jgi:hypothetical protein